MKKHAQPDKRQRSLLQFFRPPNEKNENDRAENAPVDTCSDEHNDAYHPEVELMDADVQNTAPQPSPLLESKIKIPVEASEKETGERASEPPENPPIAMHTTTTTTTTSPQAAEKEKEKERSIIQPINGMNDYELQRQERIRRNINVMQSLGLGPGAGLSLSLFPPDQQQRESNAKNARTSSSQRKRRLPPPPPVAGASTSSVRRSQRHRGSAASAINPDQENVVENNNEEAEENDLLVFDDSSVQKYICQVLDKNKSTTVLHHPQTPLSDASFISGFNRVPGLLLDSALARAYSIHCHTASGLVAAAGKDGQCSVWGINSLLHSCDIDTSDDDDGKEEEEEEKGIESLLSYKAHKGWISDAQLISSTSGSSNDQGVFLLSAGNDGVMSLWDVTKSTEMNSSSQKEVPRRLATTSTLHSSGIFSMHCAPDHSHHIVTASKDSSVVLSKIESERGGFEVVRRFENLHTGVVKSVRWRESCSPCAVFASCGNDRTIQVTDIREHSTSAGQLVLENVHRTAINCLRWSPSSEYLILSASHDPSLLVHDIRKPDQPLFAFSGHSPPQKHRLQGILQPCFVGGGAAVVVAGEPADQLNLYSLAGDVGRTVSRGKVDFAVGAVFCGGTEIDAPLLCSGNRCVAVFTPK